MDGIPRINNTYKHETRLPGFSKRNAKRLGDYVQMVLVDIKSLILILCFISRWLEGSDYLALGGSAYLWPDVINSVEMVLVDAKVLTVLIAFFALGKIALFFMMLLIRWKNKLRISRFEHQSNHHQQQHRFGAVPDELPLLQSGVLDVAARTEAIDWILKCALIFLLYWFELS
ncbi:hypothetical protein P8452_73410 [Trifolium repens]|nr:hypothetical protein P8452_73410 [Trifolium repens]